eukprot:TRINITY_DN23817_c0_g1_i1.p1 TRINITY_DN23817_c0_g1~~TRINITY_DN23817_c0_g1_i1.p1  ORF type:complete len:319 (-),score=23.65 TRINITY_DN23817_c0_g1_i1:32-988(-)
MGWYYFAWTVLPSGAAFVLLLLSGQPFLMMCAHSLLASPLRVGKLSPSLATLMTVCCATLCLLCFSSLRRAELNLEQTDVHSHPLLWEQRQNAAHRAGRNLYMCILGSVVWAIAWRLNSMYITKSLRPRMRPPCHARPLVRAMYLVIGICCIVLADLPLCRLNYALQVATFVTPKKNKVMAGMGPCESVFREQATGQCIEFCNKAHELCHDRLWSIRWARSWHVFGRLFAEAFDAARGVTQGEERINDAFTRKTCADVARSVDKTNKGVNTFCAVIGCLSLMAALTAVTSAFFDDEDDVAPPDPVSGTHPCIDRAHSD